MRGRYRTGKTLQHVLLDSRVRYRQQAARSAGRDREVDEFIVGGLSGVDIFAGAGLLEGELTYDAAQLIIDNEIAKYGENILRGIEVNDEALCFDLIKETGIGGNFLETEQTLGLFKTD